MISLLLLAAAAFGGGLLVRFLSFRSGMGQISLALAVAISFSLEMLLLWIFDGDAVFFWLSVVWTGLILIVMTMAWAILDLVRQSRDEANG